MFKQWQKGLMLFFGLTLTVSAAIAQEEELERDPWEGLNRNLYVVHKGLDARFLRPLAVSYNAILPPPARSSVTNFFRNVNEIPNTINSILQAKPKQALIGTSRFLINSTLGIAGLFDVATKFGIERKPADFGQTLSVWGWKKSTFIIVPLLGPTTLRDGLGIGADYYLTPWPYLPDNIDWTAFGIYVISARASYLDSEALLNAAALDEYAFIRDAYLQNRAAFISGGAPPAEEYYDDNWYE